MMLNEFLGSCRQLLSPLISPSQVQQILDVFAKNLSLVLQGGANDILRLQTCLQTCNDILYEHCITSFLTQVDTIQAQIGEYLSGFTELPRDAEQIAELAKQEIVKQVLANKAEQEYLVDVLNVIQQGLKTTKLKIQPDLSFNFELEERLSDWEDVIANPFLTAEKKIKEQIVLLLKPIEKNLLAEGSEYLYLADSLKNAITDQINPLQTQLITLCRDKLTQLHSADLMENVTALTSVECEARAILEPQIDDAIQVWCRDKTAETIAAMNITRVKQYMLKLNYEIIFSQMLQEGLLQLQEIVKPLDASRVESLKPQIRAVLHYTKKYQLDILLDDAFPTTFMPNSRARDAAQCLRDLLLSFPPQIQQLIKDATITPAVCQDEDFFMHYPLTDWAPDEYALAALENPLFNQVKQGANVFRDALAKAAQAQANIDVTDAFMTLKKLAAEPQVNAAKLQTILQCAMKGSNNFTLFVRNSNLLTLEAAHAKLAQTNLSTALAEIKNRIAILKPHAALAKTIQTLSAHPLFKAGDNVENQMDHLDRQQIASVRMNR